ncbi:MAG: hypothetical protein MOB07_00120 [Acidobacteria bacterium]|nr:hypothetical protein [Acidobacteriota bacterium]
MISLSDIPRLLLTIAVRRMPAERSEWGAAMLAELAQLQNPSTRWWFALGCTRVALFPPRKGGLLQTIMNHKMKSIITTLGAVALISFIIVQPFERGGAWLAWAYTIYGLVFLLIPAIFFADLLLLAAVVWAVAGHVRGRQPWPNMPTFLRRWGRLAVEIVFGLLNPVLYLAILTTALPLNRPGTEWWLAPLTTSAWILVTAFWTLRICGAAFDPRSRAVRAGVRTLLLASLACLLVYTIKDASLLVEMEWSRTPLSTFLLNVLRLCPLYLIPAVLLWDYLRATSTLLWQSGEATGRRHGLFLLPNRASRVVVASVVGVALVTFALTAHRRSEASVRKLVSDHRAFIHAAATRYDVDPRLIAAIIYVTHRDQLSPFRDALERLIISAWAMKMQRRDPGRERWEEIGTDENPMLNRALDISVGLAQIKPRTAQTASVLATGRTPDNMPRPAFYEYRDVEPVGDGWTLPATAQTFLTAPIPVPAERHVVAGALLDAESNLETCALILALYQNQWEATNRDWSIRERPDILATLYQIGFARSKPHGAPRSNAFGSRVRQAYEQPWLGELFDATPRPPK